MTATAAQRIAGLLPPFLLGFFLVGTTGFDLLPGLGVFNAKRILEVVVLTLLLGATLAHPGLRRACGELLGAVPRWAFLALGLAALAGVLSALRFPHPGYGLLEVAMLALLAVAIVATAASRRLAGATFDRLAILVVATVGLMAALTEFMGLFAAWMSGFEFSYDIMLVRFFHPRFYNQLQTLSIPLLAALPFIFGGSGRLKVLAVVLIALQWCLVLVSGGRGSVVSVLAALALAAVLFPGARRQWLGLHAAGLLLGAALFLAVVQVNQSVTPGGEGQLVAQSVGREMAHTSGRLHMWQIGWGQALEQPLLGQGPSRYACELRPDAPAHPHNFPVTLLAEWGFPAFLLIMVFCAWLGLRLVLGCRKQGADAGSGVLVAMLGCSIAAGAGHALLSGVLIMPASQVLVVLVGGWAFGRLNAGDIPNPAGRRIAALTLVAATLLAAGISAFAISEVRQLEARTGGLDKRHRMEPRFWQYGHACKYTYPGDPAPATADTADGRCEITPLVVTGGAVWLGGGALEETELLLTDGRIEEIGESVRRPPGAGVLDASGLVVLPGLVDLHSHFFELGGPLPARVDPEHIERNFDAIAATLLASGVTQARAHLMNLEHGPRLVERAGDDCHASPRIDFAGPGFFGGMGDFESFQVWGVTSAQDARDKVRRVAEAGAGWIAVHRAAQFRGGELEAIADEARTRGLRILGAGDNPADLLRILQIAPDTVDYLPAQNAAALAPEVAASLSRAPDTTVFVPLIGAPLRDLELYENPGSLDFGPLGRLLPDEVIDKIRNDIASVYTDPESKEHLAAIPHLPSLFRQYRELGLPLAMGTDNGSAGHFHYAAIWREMAHWHALGVPVEEILAAATTRAADVLGRAEPGTVEPGRRADLLLYSGDLAAGDFNYRNVAHVIKGGVVHPGVVRLAEGR